MNAGLSRAVAVLGLFAVAACVSEQPRPADWPADVAITDIRQVEGSFMRGGAVFGRMLESALVQDEDVRISSAPDSQLAFEFILPDGTAKRVVRPYRIADGWVKVGNGDGTNREGVVGYEKTTFALRLDPTGALIVDRTGYAAGLMLLIPVAGKQQNWIRLERASAARPAPVLHLTGADVAAVAAAWHTNFGEAVSVTERAKTRGASLEISARTRSEFRAKAIAALRAQHLVIRGDRQGGAVFDLDSERSASRDR